MKTNGPRDLKLGFKKFLKYPFNDQRCYKKLFFQNWDLKGLHFWQRAKEGAPQMVKNALQENGAPSDPDFRKRISGNIFDLKEYSLGIILRPISGLEDD